MIKAIDEYPNNTILRCCQSAKKKFVWNNKAHTVKISRGSGTRRSDLGEYERITVLADGQIHVYEHRHCVSASGHLPLYCRGKESEGKD